MDTLELIEKIAKQWNEKQPLVQFQFIHENGCYRMVVIDKPLGVKAKNGTVTIKRYPYYDAVGNSADSLENAFNINILKPYEEYFKEIDNDDCEVASEKIYYISPLENFTLMRNIVKKSPTFKKRKELLAYIKSTEFMKIFNVGFKSNGVRLYTDADSVILWDSIWEADVLDSGMDDYYHYNGFWCKPSVTKVIKPLGLKPKNVKLGKIELVGKQSKW